MKSKPKVLIITGSDSDIPIIENTTSYLEQLGISYELRISSAHRSPEMTKDIVSKAQENGHSLIIAAAGLAAHLPGVCAAYTTLPVIGIPISSGELNGVDALYSIVMMPPGVPVGTVGIGKVGAINAAILAAQILTLKYPELQSKLIDFKKNQADKTKNKDQKFSKKKDI